MCIRDSRYVEAGKAEFTAALETAQTVFDDGDAMQAEINESADNLLNAMLNLRYKADKSVLEDVLAEAGKVDANAYTAESYAALQAVVAVSYTHLRKILAILEAGFFRHLYNASIRSFEDFPGGLEFSILD